MINSTSGAGSTDAASSFSFTNPTSTGSVDSFAQQLLSAIEGYLNKSGTGSQLEIDIQGQQGQNSGGNSQFVVTLKNLGNTPPATAASPATAPPAAAPATTPPATALSTSTGNQSTPVGAATATSAATPLTAAQLANMTPDQAYWAAQPPAVQALQYTPDDQRAAVAQQLADQGYSIDVPIMVWNWDPLATMIQRQIDGYTWVPSALQSNIVVGPGLNVPGAPAYDPHNPPPGAIPVSTAFAIGTNGQDNWIKNFNTTTGTLNS